MNAKRKLYKEICIFIKQNGKQKHGIYEIEFDHVVYQLTDKGIVIITTDRVSTVYSDLFKVKILTTGFKPYEASLFYLARIMDDLKMNISDFLLTKF